MLQGRHHTQLDAHPEPSPDPELPGAGNQGSHTAASCLPSLECAGLGWINSLTSITWQTYYRKKTSPIINWCAEQTFPKVYVKEKKKRQVGPTYKFLDHGCQEPARGTSDTPLQALGPALLAFHGGPFLGLYLHHPGVLPFPHIPATERSWETRARCTV